MTRVKSSTSSKKIRAPCTSSPDFVKHHEQTRWNQLLTDSKWGISFFGNQSSFLPAPAHFFVHCSTAPAPLTVSNEEDDNVKIRETDLVLKMLPPYAKGTPLTMNKKNDQGEQEMDTRSCGRNVVEHHFPLEPFSRSLLSMSLLVGPYGARQQKWFFAVESSSLIGICSFFCYQSSCFRRQPTESLEGQNGNQDHIRVKD